MLRFATKAPRCHPVRLPLALAVLVLGAWMVLPSTSLFADEEKKATFTLTSSAFKDGQPIPRVHSIEGENQSPPLAWADAPPGTRQFSLVMHDADGPTREPLVHWVIYNLAAEVDSIKTDRPRDLKLEEPKNAYQGRHSFGEVGYRGPAPQRGSGVHRYVFTLYALDAELDLKPGVTRPTLLKAMEDHVLGQATLEGTYERK